MLDKDLQYLKDCELIDVTFFPIVIDSNKLHLSNVHEVIALTLSGISIDFNEEQPAKAYCLIVVTP